MSTSKDLQSIYIDEFDYHLPDERIAKYPLSKRDASKLLVYKNDEIIESKFSEISSFLPPNSLLVYNNTRVIQARLIFKKNSGAKIEIFCLEPLELNGNSNCDDFEIAEYEKTLAATTSCIWKCMVGNLKKWKEGKLIKRFIVNNINCNFEATLLNSSGNTHTIHFSWDNENIHFAEILEIAGELPIPPYLHRKTEESDLKTYQTVYSKIKGSVAAPTAGLHFTSEVFECLQAKNILTEELTLHVGAGTFQPVKTRDIEEHHMHTEVISVKRSTIENLQKNLGNIIAVGTTSVRTLESLYYLSSSLPANIDNNVGCYSGLKLKVKQWAPYNTQTEISAFDALQGIIDYLDANKLTALHAETQIMIKPGYKFKIVNAIITNFHQPKSTLLLLVSAFVNGKWKKIYDYALLNDFRFLSYGDSSLLIP